MSAFTSVGDCALAIGEKPRGDAATASLGNEKTARRYSVLVTLNDEQMAAAEGWRLAHGIADQAEAFGELIRLGLLSEIAKIYQLVSNNRASSARSRNGGSTVMLGIRPTAD